VTLNSSLEGELSPFPVGLTKNVLPLPFGTSNPTRESCFDEEAPLQPRARHYATAFTHTSEPEQGETPSFTLSFFNLKVTTPDLSEGDGALETTVRLSVGVCH
jgi:hypothetical protein